MEREFDQKEALQKFVNETTAMLEESMQNTLAPNLTPNLDDYDDIESLSMTMTAIENNMQSNMPENSLKEAKNFKNSHPIEAAKTTNKTNSQMNGKKDCGATKSKELSDRKVVDRNVSLKPGVRAKSPPPISKRRSGILKKPKEAPQNKANNTNSSLQRKLANKSATNSLKNSIPRNSRSTTNLNHFNSMIPKLDHLKSGTLMPMPRKCRSTSNLVTAVGFDWDSSKPSLIPRPVNKTVTFAENLVKQIQSRCNLGDEGADDGDEEAGGGDEIPAPGEPVEHKAIAAESDEVVQEKDAGEGVSLEEKVADEDGDDGDGDGGGSRANDAEVDDKTGKFSLPTSTCLSIMLFYGAGIFTRWRTTHMLPVVLAEKFARDSSGSLLHVPYPVQSYYFPRLFPAERCR